VAVNEQTLQFVRDSLNAINDSYAYGGPVYLQLTGYEEVQASGLQLTRSPGKNIVYTGSVLLILGVFAMFYIRERRICCWSKRRIRAGRARCYLPCRVTAKPWISRMNSTGTRKIWLSC